MENKLAILKVLNTGDSSLFSQAKNIKNFYSPNFIYVVLLKPGLTVADIRNKCLIYDALILKIIPTSQLIEIEDKNVEKKFLLFYASTQEEFDWLSDYHSYSNSVILGKIFKGAGFKLSDQGLQYIHKHIEPNHQVVIGTIDVCKDYKKLLTIIGLSYSEYQNNIDSKEDLFKFFLKSPYLNSKKFISDEKEYKNEVMIDFEKFLILNKIVNNYQAPTFEEVTSHFPEIDFKSKIEEFNELALRKKGINDKFNGRVILESITGYQQKDLGYSIKNFKESFGSKEAYENFVISNSQEQIIEKFKEVTMSI